MPKKSQPDMPFPNLAFTFPEDDLNKIKAGTNTMLFVSPAMNPAFFYKINGSCPVPAYLRVSDELARSELLDADYQRIKNKQNEVWQFFTDTALNADETARLELTLAKVPIVTLPTRPYMSEVPTVITGAFKHYTFERSWRYWSVTGETSKDVAVSIYNDPVGRSSIRTNGYAGNKHPSAFDYIVGGYDIDDQEGLNRFIELVS